MALSDVWERRVAAVVSLADARAGVELELLATRHLDAVAALFADPEVQRFTRVPVPVPDGYEETWFGLYEHGRQTRTREAFAVVDRAGGGCVGVATAAHIDIQGRTAELGYVVIPEARRRGVGAAALRLLTDWAFSALSVARLELLIVSGNLPSKHVAQRCGYRREGLMRSIAWKDGVREDVELWSRLAWDPAP